MGLFNRTPCDGQHRWGKPERSELWGNVAFRTRCQGDDCQVASWGDSPAEAMAHAQDLDRAQRAGRL